eukprot:scaffold31132_cov34-Attheya_sp.AAC.1
MRETMRKRNSGMNILVCEHFLSPHSCSHGRADSLTGEQLLYRLSRSLLDEQHQGILAWQCRRRLATLHNWSTKPDSSDNLENEVKDDEQVSEDVEGVKEEDVVKSLLEELADLKEKRLALSLPSSLSTIHCCCHHSCFLSSSSSLSLSLYVRRSQRMEGVCISFW